MGGLVDRLLRDEDETLRYAVAPGLASLRLAQDDVDDLFRQGLGRLDVEAESDDPPAAHRRGNRECLVMRQRTDDPGGPQRRAGRRARQRRRPVGAELVEQGTGGDAGGPARAAYLDARPGPGIGERGFVAWPDSPRRDKRAVSRELHPQRREVEVVPRLCH